MADINRTRGGIQTQLIDDTGAPVTSGEVYVKSQKSKELITLYTGPYPDGIATIPNPFNLEDYFGDGTIRFFIDPQEPENSNSVFSVSIEVNVERFWAGENPSYVKRILVLPVGSADYFWVGTGQYDLMLQKDLDLRYQSKSTDNLSAVTDPTVDDDSDDGYSVGSLWINTASSPQEAFRCVDATVGAAVWVNTTLTIGELGSVALLDTGTAGDEIRTNSQNDLVYNPLIKNNLTAIADPDITNDSSEGYEVGSLWLNTTSSPLEISMCLDDSVGAAIWKVISLDSSELGTLAYINVGTGDYQVRYNVENDELYASKSSSFNINEQTGTSYTVLSTDIGKVIRFTNASAITLTINTGFSAGFNFVVEQAGAGTITWAGTATLNSISSTTSTAGQYSIVSFISTTADQFTVTGDYI